MHRKRATYLCGVALFVIGGLVYNLIEILWRGRTHWSMFLVGGCCFRIIGKIFTVCSRVHWLWRATLCGAAITAVEFISGCIVNLQLGLGVWDYTNMPMNICGQVCLLYSGFWAGLSVPAAYVYRYCERTLHRLFRANADKRTLGTTR